MSKVEELREQIRAYLGDIDDNQHRDITKEAIDSLIAAAEARGFENGKAEGVTEFEKERAETFNKLIDDHDTAFAAGKAEGAEQERERIVRGSQRFSQGDDVADSDYVATDYATKIDFAAVADCELFIVPASVLSPKEKP